MGSRGDAEWAYACNYMHMIEILQEMCEREKDGYSNHF